MTENMALVPLPDGVDPALAMRFFEAIALERVRAHAKHGATSMEQAELLAHRRASILTEEAVECAKALNDHEHGDIMLASESDVDSEPVRDELDKELIQTAAMAYTWWANRRGNQLPPPVTGEDVVSRMRAVIEDLAELQRGAWQGSRTIHEVDRLITAARGLVEGGQL